MRQTNLSVFIPHAGCPHRCSFCAQRTISGSVRAPSPSEVADLLERQRPHLEQTNTAAEIAFFGGSFTAVEREYRTALLETAADFIRRYPGQYNGIRCSTRPDAIDRERLGELKKYGATAIELGAQSMSDEVLSANRRGHTSDQVRQAAALIREYGFSLGLQMMTGLYRDTPERCRDTAREFIAMRCDTVRIYPTAILRGTELGTLYGRGEYQSFGFDETAELCAQLLEMFREAGIPVIRLGLHASEEIERERLGGVYHPAFREIVESRSFLREMKKRLLSREKGSYLVFTDRRNISRAVGQKRANIAALRELGYETKVLPLDGAYILIKERGSDVF